MIKLADIAEQAGVSESTASRALANSPRISAVKRELIQRIALEAGYTVNQVARNLRVQSTKTLGLVIPEITNPFFPRLVQLIADSAIGAGYRLQLHLSGVSQESEGDCLAALREQRVDGVILVTSENGLVAREALSQMVAFGVPAVLLGWVSGEPPVDMVFGNDATGGYLVAKHFTDLGHRRVAILGAVPHRGPFDRLVGFRKGLMETPGVTEIVVPARTNEEVRLGIDHLLGLDKPPTAIFAYQDSLAAMACRCLRQSCVSIPEEISVVGFDNLELGTYLCPQLTTVDLSMEQMASCAVETLLGRLKTPSFRGDPNQIVIPPQLFVRESTSRPRSTQSIKKTPCEGASHCACD